MVDHILTITGAWQSFKSGFIRDQALHIRANRNQALPAQRLLIGDQRDFINQTVLRQTIGDARPSLAHYAGDPAPPEGFKRVAQIKPRPFRCHTSGHLNDFGTRRNKCRRARRIGALAHNHPTRHGA